MVWGDEEHTRPGLNRPPSSSSLRSVSEVPSDDPHELLGKVMRAVARLETRVDDLKLLPGEVRALRDEIKHDRGELVRSSSTRAAKHAGNRLAVLMSVLFTLYEMTAPTVHEWWRTFHH